MQTETAKRPQSTGRRPTHRAWLVTDRPDSDKPLWTELTGLWPTRKGSGLSGGVARPVALADGFLTGHLVILPARMLAKHLEKRSGTIPPERVDDVYRRLAAALPA